VPVKAGDYRFKVKLADHHRLPHRLDRRRDHP
jgi:hypothetical protein